MLPLNVSQLSIYLCLYMYTLHEFEYHKLILCLSYIFTEACWILVWVNNSLIQNVSTVGICAIDSVLYCDVILYYLSLYHGWMTHCSFVFIMCWNLWYPFVNKRCLIKFVMHVSQLLYLEECFFCFVLNFTICFVYIG